MFVITGGGWLVLIITAMTQLPASSFIPSFVRLIIICLLPLKPVHSGSEIPKVHDVADASSLTFLSFFMA